MELYWHWCFFVSFFPYHKGFPPYLPWDQTYIYGIRINTVHCLSIPYHKVSQIRWPIKMTWGFIYLFYHKLLHRAIFMNMRTVWSQWTAGSEGPCIDSIFCCHHLEILNNFYKGSSWTFFTMSHKLCSYFCFWASDLRFWFRSTVRRLDN